ncbi:MAG TPA: hypothetical protein VGR07_02150 [Thermoanaerobaculia bacterium]|nr:hypothetical protein [Thermoanaerobaculia bacterium]
MTPPTEEEATALARAALGQELGIAPAPFGDIELVRAEPVDWPDASLGCPEKGMAYAQVVIPGWRMTLRAAGREWRVHVGGHRAVVSRYRP